MGTTTVELIGYLASALIAISLLMTSVLRLRVINLVGSLVFTAYGALIGSIPVVLTNVVIVAINVYHLVRIARDRAADAYFEVVAVEPTSPVLRRFVGFHTEDARRYQPGFDGLRDDHLAWMVLRDAIPVGTVLARHDEVDAEVARIDLDYVVPAHRDFTAGTVLFGDAGAFRAAGFHAVASEPGTEPHRRYLERMGFARDGSVWRRPVR